MTLLAAFVRALRDASALADTLDTLTRERWSFDAERHRHEAELRFMAAELAEARAFIAAMEPSVRSEK